MRFFSNLLSRSEYGLVIDWRFHTEKRWVSIFAPHLVERFIREFNPIIISNQLEYDLCKKRVKYILSMEPGWSAPKISYDTRCAHVVAVMASDPHNKTGWLSEYVARNGIKYVLSQYLGPFFYHFPDFPEECFVHFPWAVPDEFLSSGELTVQSDRVAIFGAQAGNSYDVRNWCRSHAFVENHHYSGVENKKLSDEEYFSWLKTFDALVAAGSSDPTFNLVTPKYFEIAAVGALLIGQSCSDLPLLGFGEESMIVFIKDNFVDKVLAYKKNPEAYLSMRARGQQVVTDRHLISHRIDLLKRLFS